MRSRLLFAVLLIGLAGMVGCAGGNNTSGNNFVVNPPAATASVVQVTMGDDPGDRVASLSITINAATLTSTTGATVSLLAAPATVEISSLAGTTTPLGTVTVPAGTYNKATLTLGSATITVVDPGTGNSVQRTFNAPPNPFTINLNPVFVSDGTALVINLDMDLHASVAIDSSGNITFNPLFIASHGKMSGPPTGIGPNPFTGGIERTVGTVSAVTTSGFTITTAMGLRSLTFTTNSSTVFKGVGGLSSLLTGMIVVVGGQTQSDGSLLAVGVALVDAMRVGPGAVGVVTKTTGTPVTQFTLLTQGLATMTTPLMGLGTAPQIALTVNVGAGTNFEPDADDIDVSGFTFDANSLSPAQAVAVGARSPLSVFNTGMSTLPVAGTLDAAQIRLLQQPLTGTISNLGTDKFTLTVASDSVFATLAKTTTVTVLKQTKTQVKDGLTLANGQKVVVRGLLFNNSGYQMVATRIGQ